MKLDIKKFYDHPYVFNKEWEDLVIFCYTRACQYDRQWDDVTTNARGIIFNKVTGEIVARPFKKFFNASELTSKIDIKELAKKPFTVLKKIDGSLGITFCYKDQAYVATKGSFFSDPAVWATDWLRRNIDFPKMMKGYTYLFEIIYPENRIVIDYGDTENLVLLSIINNETGIELDYDIIKKEAESIGATVVESFTFTSLEELYDYCKDLPSNEEGFVITFHDGTKVKVKGSEYCKIHKIIAYMTPLSFWDAWDSNIGDIQKSFLINLPEEFRELSDTLYKQIYDLHYASYRKTEKEYEEILKVIISENSEHDVFLKISEMFPENVTDLMFLHKKKYYKLWKSIHRKVRPTFNILPDSISGSQRVKRILEEN